MSAPAFTNNEPHCPECGEELSEPERGTTGDGTEYHVFRCPVCDWVSDPE